MKISRLRVIDTRLQLAFISARLKRGGTTGNEGRQRTFYSALTADSRGRNGNTKPMVARRSAASHLKNIFFLVDGHGGLSTAHVECLWLTGQADATALPASNKFSIILASTASCAGAISY